jgi:hypothetical protein
LSMTDVDQVILVDRTARDLDLPTLLAADDAIRVILL